MELLKDVSAIKIKIVLQKYHGVYLEGFQLIIQSQSNATLLFE